MIMNAVDAPGPWPVPAPARDPRDPSDTARDAERLMWRASGLLDDAHRAASATDREPAGPLVLADRLRALAELAERLRAVAVDTGSGDALGEGGDLLLLLDERAPTATACDRVATALLLVDQAAALLPVASSLLLAAVARLQGVQEEPAIAQALPSSPARGAEDFLASLDWLTGEPLAGGLVDEDARTARVSALLDTLPARA